ncbi:MAG: hypothetical protein FWD68_01100 [Alphaproteobacteria bacterium]|nr:hypothetical protein [Alphaproteobacteria bacterium]
MTDKLPQSGSAIPDDHHVIRYVGGRHVDGDVINGEAFLTKPQEDAPSVNWVEYFDPPIDNQVQGVRSAARLQYGKTGKLVRLNVGATRDYVRENSPDGLQLSFVSDPLPAHEKFGPDPSHALIRGVPVTDSADAALIKDLIANCVLQPFYAAVP